VGHASVGGSARFVVVAMATKEDVSRLDVSSRPEIDR
jgi:hypothetical protein